MEPPPSDNFPSMPEPGGRAHALESSASMCWIVLFLAYSSSSFVAEFGRGWPAAWTILLVIVPVALAGIPGILDRRPGAMRMLATYILYVLLPSFLQLFKPDDYTSLQAELTDLATVLIIWVPLELKLLSPDLSATGKVTVWGLLTAALNIVNIFSVLCPLSARAHARELGYTFKIPPGELMVAVAFGLAYAALSVPLAVLIGFGRVKPPARMKADKEVATFFGMFMVGIPEELLFRGLIQNMIEQRLGQDSLVALGLATAAFAIAHVGKKKLEFGKPNWRFVLVGCVSGVICGLTWRYTGKVTASAVSHAVGDYILWRLALSGKNEE